MRVSLILLLLSALCSTPSAFAWGHAPFQVGPTGIFAEWGGGSNVDPNDGDDFVTVTSVRGGSPADGVVQVGDKIFAANGTDLRTGKLQLYQVLRKDPRPVLGNAITESEAGDGRLVLDIERGGTRQDVTVQLLITNTAYSATWPENCPKTDRILQDTIDYVVNKFVAETLSDRTFTFGSLLLLAMDDDQYADELKAVMDRMFGVGDVANTGSEAGQRNLWYASLKNIVAGEYYLRTGDASVLDNLKNHVDYCYEVEAGGGWGHGYPGQGYPDPGYVFGGLVNACGGQVFVSLCLARECGVEMEDADFEKTLRYFYRYACVAAPEYGDHRPGDGGGHNGKTSQVGVGISLLNEPYHTAGRFVAAQDALNVNQFEGGHTGNYTNVLWRALSLGLVPEEKDDAYRYALNHMRWYLELCRSYDGTFTLLPAYEETRYADNNWGLMIPLYYVSGKNTLRMTGAPPTEHSVIEPFPEVMPKHADFSRLDHAEGYTEADFPYTLTANVSGMGDLSVIKKGMRHWHPVVRFNASRSIGHRANGANRSPLNEDNDPNNDLTDPAVDIVVEAMQSSDARVRTAGLMGIAGLNGFWPGETSDFNYDEDDYRRMAPYVEAILDRDDLCHWELDGAIWALAMMPEDIKLANLDHIIEIMNYEYNWWPRFAALTAFRSLPADVRAPYAMDLLEAYLTEEHSVPRGYLSGAVRQAVADGTPHFQNGEREAILKILGEDLAGGIHPRPYAYQQDHRYSLDANSLNAILDAYSYTEFESIADELNIFFTRTANPAERLNKGGQSIITPLVVYFDDINFDDPAVLAGLAPIMPGIKAMSLGKISEIYTQNNIVSLQDASDWQNFVDRMLANHQTIVGDVPLVPNYAFDVAPPLIRGDMPFPDTNAQMINFELEEGSGTSVFNHGMRGYSSPGILSSDTGWSATGVAPGSTASLDANLAYLTAANPTNFHNDATISCWIRLDENLPDSDAHYVAFSALKGFDLGVRRLQVGGVWKNTIFFDSSLWGGNDPPLYGLNDSTGRPDIFLETGKDYFIMFEGIQHEETDLTLLHVFDPVGERWLTSDGNHQNPGGARFVSDELSVGIGSLDAEVLDPDTGFPGLIDNAQIWTGTTPLTPAEKLTLAVKGSITDVGLQPWVKVDPPYNVDATSAQIDCVLASNAPAGAVITVFYGLSDGGENPATWDHTTTIALANGKTALPMGTYSQLLESLTPNSTYYLRIRAQNPVGAMLEHWSPTLHIIETLPVDNDFTPPVADLGVDILISDTDYDGIGTVTLNGSASTDDFGIQTYTWTDTAGNILYSGPNDTAQVELALGQYLLTLTTTDFNNNSSQDQYHVYIMDHTGPGVDTGPGQVLVDYDGNGVRRTYFDGEVDAAAVSASWMLEGQEVSTTSDFTIDLPVGEHVLILTATAADGSSRSDSVRVEVLSEAQALSRWTLLDEAAIPSRSIIAAQDFTELGAEVLTHQLERSYPSSEFPVDEGLDYWPFSFTRSQPDSVQQMGEFGVRTNQRFQFNSTYYYYIAGTYLSDPIATNGAYNLTASMQFARSTIKTPGNFTYAWAKAHCTMADGTVEEVTIYNFDTNALKELNTTLEMAELPDGTVSVVIEAKSTLSNPAFHNYDNIVIAGTTVDPPTVTAVTPGPGDVGSFDATLRGVVTDNGNRDPEITFYYGLTDQGSTAEGWDSSASIGRQGGEFSYLATGLVPGETYYYRIHFDNGAGNGFTGPVTTFTTPKTTAAISSNPAAGATGSEVTFSGEITNTGGDIPNVVIYYGMVNRGETAVGWEGAIDLGPQSGSFVQFVAGLEGNESYAYRIAATNSEGTSWSAAQQFYTFPVGMNIITSDQNGNFTTSGTWAGDVVPADGEAAIQKHLVHYSTSSRGVDVVGISSGGISRISNNVSFEKKILNEGGEIYWQKGNKTVSIDSLTLNGGTIYTGGSNSGNTLAANTMAGDGEVTWYQQATNTFANAFEIDCPDMTGFTGRLIVGTSGSDGEVDLTRDILPENASFSLALTGDGDGDGDASRFVLSGHVAVISLSIDGTELSPGTYTLDTASNPGAIDLTNVNGIDYSIVFADVGGTIAVTGPLKPMDLTAVASGSEVRLSWSPFNGATAYNIYRSLTANGSYSEIASNVSATTYTDLNVTAGTTYHYTITAVTSGLESPPSEEAFAFLSPPPATPIVTTAAATGIGAYTATVGGSVSSFGGETPTVTLYYGSTDGGQTPENWDHSVDLGFRAGSFSQTLKPLQDQSTFVYRIRASNSAGEDWSDTPLNFTTLLGEPTLLTTKDGDITQITTWLNEPYVPTTGTSDAKTWRILHKVRRGSGSISFAGYNLEIGDGLNNDGTLDLETGSGTLTVRNVVLNSNGRIEQDKDTNTLIGDTLTIHGDGGVITPDRLSGNRQMRLRFENYTGSGTVYVYGNNDSGTPNVVFQTTNPNPGTAMQGFTGTIHRDRLSGSGGAIAFNFSVTVPTFAIVLGDTDTDLPPGTSNGGAEDDPTRNGKMFLTSGVDVMVRDLHLFDQAADGTTLIDVHLPNGTYTLDPTTNPGAIDLTNVGGQDYSRFFVGGTGTVTVAPPTAPSEYNDWITNNLTDLQKLDYQANPKVDFDGDGLDLMKEFYFARDHLASDSNSLIQSNVTELPGHFKIRYQRRKNHDGVTVTYETSTDLKNWNPLINPTELISDITSEIEAVEVSVPMIDANCFIRIVLTD